ncbi:dTDP-4-dehydrorhamnose reductase [uncultured Alistipes sp.]|uniref:dTDP-4-dehydrorhamnose reductase n=1 Tax=uncultured Alistipes sp. TaxID=538949 RepID=UPI0026289534|nr:dTDP-4-dehydrorhamnose reductase [uncultured Alistipes sp.]
MNILVTGADGQLGRELRRVTAGSADRYIFTDAAELDITDAEAVDRTVREEQADVVVNCAAYTNVDRAEEDEATADLLNHRAVAYLSAAAARYDALLVHVSTDYVFGGEGNLPRREEDPVNPLGVYGRTKLAGERAVADSGCRYLIFRTAWLYSPHGNNFVKTMLRLSAERDRLNVVFDQVGTPTYAGDLACAIFGIVEERKYEGREGVYHFSDEGVCSWYDFAAEIAGYAGHTACEIRPCHSDEFPSKVKRPAYSVLDKTKIKETFGLRIPHWRESLGRCLERMEVFPK